MKHIFALFIFTVMAGCSAVNPVADQSEPWTESQCAALIQSGASEAVIAQRGCCSWHDGVCGCDSYSGRLQCCDGSLSPSCGC